MEKVNKKWLEQRSEQELKETIIKVEVDEMHSFVAKKTMTDGYGKRSTIKQNLSFCQKQKRRSDVSQTKKAT